MTFIRCYFDGHSTWLWRPQDERNMLELGWIHSWYIWHMYDKADRSAAGAHLLQNDCHPKGHDNDLALKCPGYLQNKQIRKIVLLFNLSYNLIFTLMRTEIKVKLCWMSDSNINSCSSWNISRFSTLFFLVSTE